MRAPRLLLAEQATVLEQRRCPEQQYLLRLRAPRIAGAARPGTFVHMQCDPMLPMRRPMSIMRAKPNSGELEILYVAHGVGTRLLAQKQNGALLELLGPAGRPFKLEGYRERPLLIGGGVGIPPLLFLAEHMARQRQHPLALLGSERPFPLTTSRITAVREHLPGSAALGLEALERLGIASALASGTGQPGCYPGHVTALAEHWLRRLPQETRAQVEIFACGPPSMLAAAAALAGNYGLPCEVSLEEYMACATGGCGACVVPFHDSRGNVSMQRVCVEGPVFDARAVFPG